MLEGVQKSEILVKSEELHLNGQNNVPDETVRDVTTSSDQKAETECAIAAEPNGHSNLESTSSQDLNPDNVSQEYYNYYSEEDYYRYYAQFKQHQSYQQCMQEHQVQVINILTYVRFI